MTLKETLQELVKQTTITYDDELLNEMLDNIGDPDSELRDELICNLFYDGIPGGGISQSQQIWLVEEILQRNLVLNDIEVENDQVFTRTFSLLVLALIMTEDSRGAFLTSGHLETIAKTSHLYLRGEQDTRGYVEGKGWAHGIAHGADLLASVVAHPSFKREDISVAHKTIETIFLRETAPFNANEEKRLSQVIVAQLQHYPDSGKELIDWLTEIERSLQLQAGGRSYAESQLQRKYQQFLQALYFQLVTRQEQPLCEAISALILLNYP